MIRNIILAGVGGQGLLALAAVIGKAAMSLGMNVLQAEVHGMAQRGGVVQSHLRYGDEPIHSALVEEGTAHLVLSLEPMEALRYLPFLAPDGAVVTSTAAFRNIPDYPDGDALLQELRAQAVSCLVDAPALAKEAGAIQAANMVMLGAGSPFLGMEHEALLQGMRAVFADKPEAVIDTNVRAFELGLRASESEQ